MKKHIFTIMAGCVPVGENIDQLMVTEEAPASEDPAP